MRMSQKKDDLPIKVSLLIEAASSVQFLKTQLSCSYTYANLQTETEPRTALLSGGVLPLDPLWFQSFLAISYFTSNPVNVLVSHFCAIPSLTHILSCVTLQLPSFFLPLKYIISALSLANDIVDRVYSWWSISFYCDNMCLLCSMHYRLLQSFGPSFFGAQPKTRLPAQTISLPLRSVLPKAYNSLTRKPLVVKKKGKKASGVQ